MSTAPQPAKTGVFGERLRREREMRGIKLEEIAESTKIGKRNLEALEQERFDQLPGGIFNKGFVRAYAKYLGLDEEQAVNDFLAASANYDQPSALAPPIPPTWVKPPAMPSEASIRRKNRLWALTALLALVAGFALWFYYARAAQQRSAGPDKYQGTALAVPNSTEMNSVRDRADAKERADAPNPSAIAPAAQSRAASSAATQPEVAVPSTAPDSVVHWQAQPPPTAAAPNAAANAVANDARVARAPSPANAFANDSRQGTVSTVPKTVADNPAREGASRTERAQAAATGVTLKVRATQEVWLTLTADGQPLSSLTLLSGESRDFHARRELMMRTGNAGGVALSLNGKPLPPLGKDKQVKTVTFTAEGIKR